MTAGNSAFGRVRQVVAADWGTIAFCCLAGGFFAGAFGLRGQAGHFPMGVSTMTVAFGIAVLILALRSPEANAAAAVATMAEHDIGRRRGLLTVAWFALALAATYVFGIAVGAAIAAPLYFLALTSVGPVRALTYGLSFSLFIWLIFKKAAGLPLYGGIF